MNKSMQKLLTIITESVLEASLIKDIERLGAKGHTIMDVRGKGSKGLRSGGWDASANIRIEVICGDAVAESISAHLQEKYYNDYAMVIYTSEVSVLRPEKF
jgi:hypothetical protein